MKKIISLILCFLLTFSVFLFPVYATVNDNSMEYMRDILVSYGLLDYYVNSMADVEVENLYNKLITGESEIFIVQEHITMDANQGSVDTYGFIDEDNFQLTVGLVVDYDINNNNKIKKAAGLVMWQWRDGHPGGRRDDLLHIRW